jgi:hypothetical protein
MASDAQEWLDLSLKYWKYHTNAFMMQQLQDPETGMGILRYILNSYTPASRQHAEHALANIAVMVRRRTTASPARRDSTFATARRDTGPSYLTDRDRTSISSATFLRCSAALPLAIAWATQCPT